MQAKNAADHVRKRYEGTLGEAYHQKHAVPPAAHEWISRSRAAKLAPYIKAKDVVLEYGVGPGWNLEALACQKRFGYDVSTFLASQLAAKGIQFVADTSSLPDGAIDTVVCHHVLEHTPDPARVLAEINRLLRGAGILILIVPYETERKYRTYHPDEPNHHLYSWTVQTLGNLVRDMGFSIRKAELGRYGYDRFLAVLTARLGLGAGGFDLLKRLALSVAPLREVRIIADKQP